MQPLALTPDHTLLHSYCELSFDSLGVGGLESDPCVVCWGQRLLSLSSLVVPGSFIDGSGLGFAS